MYMMQERFHQEKQGQTVHYTASMVGRRKERKKLGEPQKMLFLVAPPPRGGGGLRAGPLRKKNFFEA